MTIIITITDSCIEQGHCIVFLKTCIIQLMREVTFSKYHLSFMELVTDKRTKGSFDSSTVLCMCVCVCKIKEFA